MTSSNPAHSSTSLFRQLTWKSTVLLDIRLADGEPGAGGRVDRYYMHAPRYTYLPLLIPEIRENLVELALDDEQLAATDEKDWWFEEEPQDGGFAGQGTCKWHWPIDLHDLVSTISRPVDPTLPSTSSSSKSSLIPPRPLRLLLHLSAPPTDKLIISNDVEECKLQYINQLKEGDFVRWRNTNKVTSLRRADLEAGWDGLVQDDFDLYLRISSRILPLPIPPAITSLPPGSRPPSTDPSGAPKAESSYSARALPIKLYLPDNAPVIQEVIPPLLSDGKPQTVIGMLRQHLSLLFPPGANPYTMAIPICQGVQLPPDAELAWLAACLCGADGWLRIGIQLRLE
ncbi:autophagy protein 5 [Tremella mesenterica]|uniref:Autophagy protein 5 n=1 Tax=Tremella mesenterica TaxID=5217 RepID=A0A4V1M3N8_TREME|nr:autophagy protein 5 [Tremella mesenterica]